MFGYDKQECQLWGGEGGTSGLSFVLCLVIVMLWCTLLYTLVYNIEYAMPQYLLLVIQVTKWCGLSDATVQTDLVHSSWRQQVLNKAMVTYPYEWTIHERGAKHSTINHSIGNAANLSHQWISFSACSFLKYYITFKTIHIKIKSDKDLF